MIDATRLPTVLGSALLGAALLLLAPTLEAHALVIDFDDLAHGEVVAGQYAGLGVEIDVYNSRRDHDIGVAFDSERSGTSDPDLQRNAGWRGGNLAPGTVLDKLLIIQERIGTCLATTCGDPDDEGGRPAGHIDIRFDDANAEFGFDLIDVDDATAERGSITLFDDASLASATIGFEAFTSAGAFFDPSVAYGDGSANRIAPIVAAELGLGRIDRVRIAMGGSGGIDNLRFERAVPEPTAAAVFAVGLLTLTAARRRRS